MKINVCKAERAKVVLLSRQELESPLMVERMRSRSDSEKIAIECTL
jgi:hypothetical protein